MNIKATNAALLSTFPNVCPNLLRELFRGPYKRSDRAIQGPAAIHLVECGALSLQRAPVAFQGPAAVNHECLRGPGCGHPILAVSDEDVGLYVLAMNWKIGYDL